MLHAGERALEEAMGLQQNRLQNGWIYFSSNYGMDSLDYETPKKEEIFLFSKSAQPPILWVPGRFPWNKEVEA